MKRLTAIAGLAAVLFVFAVGGAAAQQASKQADLRIAGYHIPLVLTPDGQGYYNKILAELSRRTGIVMDLDVLPIARARAAYKAGQYDCLLPLDRDVEGAYASHLQSLPFYLAQAFVFVPEGKAALSSVAELKGLRVGMETGVPLSAPLAAQIKPKRVVKLEDLVQMLAYGRLDAIIAFAPEIYSVLAKMGYQDFVYDKDHPLMLYHDSLTCRPTLGNHQRMQAIDIKLFEMYQDGFMTDQTGANAAANNQ